MSRAKNIFRLNDIGCGDRPQPLHQRFVMIHWSFLYSHHEGRVYIATFLKLYPVSLIDY